MKQPGDTIEWEQTLDYSDDIFQFSGVIEAIINPGESMWDLKKGRTLKQHICRATNKAPYARFLIAHPDGKISAPRCSFVDPMWSHTDDECWERSSLNRDGIYGNQGSGSMRAVKNASTRAGTKVSVKQSRLLSDDNGF